MTKTSRQFRVAKYTSGRVGAVLATVQILVVLTSSLALALPNEEGRNTFTSTCASCHGQNGAATPTGKSLNAPDLGSSAVQSRADAELEQIISDGKNNMPPFKGSLSNEQIQSLVKYIRTFSTQPK